MPPNKKIDISQPHHCYLKEFKGNPGPCPKCGGELQLSSQTYQVVTTHKGLPKDSFLIGADIGWYCAACRVVILNPRDIEERIGIFAGRWGRNSGDDYVVTGHVNLDAVPRHKRDVPLGDEGNPIPLVKFIDLIVIPTRSNPRGNRIR